MHFNNNHIQKIGLLLLFGGVILFLSVIFIQYSMVESFKSFNTITLTQTQLEFMDRIALPSFTLYITSIQLIGLGIATILCDWMKSTSLIYPINKIHRYYYIFKTEIFLISNNSSARNALIVSFFIYLSLSLFLNNTIVYNPKISIFTSDKFYNPSDIYILGCCGNPGTFPVIIIHLTDHLGFVLTPINLIIPIIFSLLVSLTIGVIILIAKSNKDKHIKIGSCNNRTRLLTGFGAISGFFISCPTCTINILFLSLFGTGGALTMSVGSLFVASSAYQPIIAILSFVFMGGVNFFLIKRYLYDTNGDR